MPRFPSFPVPLLFGTAVLAISTGLSGPALAQVTTSEGALNQLGGDHARHAAPEHSRSSHHAAPRHAARDGGDAARSNRAASSGRVAPAATIPAAPPAAPVFRAPVINVPLHPPPPPPPVPVVPNATGTASALPDGTRITFGTGSADLNPATMAALHTFADKVKADPTLRVDLDSTASGTADDPSTPRRLALSRGLAARAVLINDGIASTRIYVRVFGPAAPNATEPADRVDLHAVGAGSAENPAAPPPASPLAPTAFPPDPGSTPAPAASATPTG